MKVSSLPVTAPFCPHLGGCSSLPAVSPKHVHQHLHRAYETREIGDYHIANEISDEVASTQVARAEEFLALVKQMLSDAPEQTP